MEEQRGDVFILQGSNWWNPESEGSVDRQDLPLMRDWIPWDLELWVSGGEPLRFWSPRSPLRKTIKVGQFGLVDLERYGDVIPTMLAGIAAFCRDPGRWISKADNETTAKLIKMLKRTFGTALG